MQAEPFHVGSWRRPWRRAFLVPQTERASSLDHFPNMRGLELLTEAELIKRYRVEGTLRRGATGSVP